MKGNLRDSWEWSKAFLMNDFEEWRNRPSQQMGVCLVNCVEQPPLLKEHGGLLLDNVTYCMLTVMSTFYLLWCNLFLINDKGKEGRTVAG